MSLLKVARWYVSLQAEQQQHSDLITALTLLIENVSHFLNYFVDRASCRGKGGYPGHFFCLTVLQ